MLPLTQRHLVPSEDPLLWDEYGPTGKRMAIFFEKLCSNSGCFLGKEVEFTRSSLEKLFSDGNILENRADFACKISDQCEDLLQKGVSPIVSLDAPSGAGKSFTKDAIVEEFNRRGIGVTFLEADCCFSERTSRKEAIQTDADGFRTHFYDRELFAHVMDSITDRGKGGEHFNASQVYQPEQEKMVFPEDTLIPEGPHVFVVEGTISTDLVRSYISELPEGHTLQQVSSHIFRDPGIPLLQAVMRDWEKHGFHGKDTFDYANIQDFQEKIRARIREYGFMLSQIYRDMVRSDFVFYDADFPVHVLNTCQAFFDTYGSGIVSRILDALHEPVMPINDKYGDFLIQAVIDDAQNYLLHVQKEGGFHVGNLAKLIELELGLVFAGRRKAFTLKI